MLDRWLPRLRENADAWIVVSRNLGSDSLQRWMDARYRGDLAVSRAAIHNGFRVLRVRNRSTPSEAAVTVDHGFD